jgi:putative transposase
MLDHVHMMISIPPKYAISQVVGFIKGKSAIHVARTYGERKRNFVGQHFWARGYFVCTPPVKATLPNGGVSGKS